MTRYFIKSTLHFFLLHVFLVCVVSIATAQTPQQIAQKAFRSTVLLVMEDKNGQPLSLGSGFFVGQGQIATNLHVVEGAIRGYAKLVGKKTKFNIEGYTAIDEKRDLIILKVTTLGTQTIHLGNSDLVQVGETVYAVGNPRGLEGTFSDGIISSIRPVGNDKLIQITAPLSPGSSGGPVLNKKGEVIGVSVFTIRDGQNLNFAIPSKYLKTLIAKVGYAKFLSQIKSNKEKGSILTDFSNPSIDGLTGGKFLWTVNTIPSYAGNDLSYTFSLRNQLRENVKNVQYLVIFYDKDGDPIDTTFAKFAEIIPAGLAKRSSGNVSDYSVKRLSTKYESLSQRLSELQEAASELGLELPATSTDISTRPMLTITKTYVKFRVLDYEIVK